MLRVEYARFAQQIVHGNAALDLQPDQGRDGKAVTAAPHRCGHSARYCRALGPCRDRTVHIAGEAEAFAKVPPRIHVVRVEREMGPQERDIARILVGLVALVSDVLKQEIALADRPAIGNRHTLDAVVNPFVNETLKPDPRVVSENAKLRIGGPVDPRTELQLPGDFALVANNRVEHSPIGNNKALVRIDIEDPFAARLLQREIAGGRKVIAPGEMVKLDWKLQRLLDRIIRRARIDDD